MLFCALTFVCLPSFSVHLENRTQALESAVHVYLPTAAVLSPDADEEMRLQLLRHDVQFYAEVHRVPRRGILGFFSRTPNFEVRTYFRSNHPVGPGRADMPLTIGTRQLLSNWNSLHRLVRQIAERSIADPEFAEWKISFTENGNEILRDAWVRRWLLVFDDTRKGARSLSGVSAEIEVEDFNGKHVVLTVPITQALLDKRQFDTGMSESAWSVQAAWEPKEIKGPEILPASIFIRTTVANTEVQRDGHELFVGIHADKWELLLVQMERDTYEWSSWSLSQIRDLMRDKTVRVAFGRTATQSGIQQIVGYVVYREHPDHIEVLSAGSLAAVKQLGVVEQMLTQLHADSIPRKAFIVARLPLSQRELLGNAGFRIWPRDVPIPAHLHDLHRGIGLLDPLGKKTEKPISGEIPVYAPEVKPGRTFYMGELPDWASEGKAPPPPLEKELAFRASVEEEVPWVDPVKQKEVEFPTESVTFTLEESEAGGSLLDTTPVSGAESKEAASVLHELRRLLRLREKARSAETDEAKDRVLNEVVSIYTHSTMIRVLKYDSSAEVKFDDLDTFLSTTLRDQTQLPSMYRLVRGRLEKYEAEDSNFERDREGEKLASIMNMLRMILRPYLPEMSVLGSAFAARSFLRSGTFAAELGRSDSNWKRRPRWEQPIVDVALEPASLKMASSPVAIPEDKSPAGLWRKESGSLRSLNIPPTKTGTGMPVSVAPVYLYSEGGLVRGGKLKASWAVNASPMNPLKGYMWLMDDEEGEQRHLEAEVLIPHLWTLEHLRKENPVQVIQGHRSFSGMPAAPATHPLFIRAWMLDDSAKKLYVVLTTEDPVWNNQVIDPLNLEPAETPAGDPSSMAAKRAAAKSLFDTSDDCARILEHAGHVVGLRKLN